jgi:hypothetical protein
MIDEDSGRGDEVPRDDGRPYGAGTAGLPQAVDALALVPGVGQSLQYLLNFLPGVALERARQTVGDVLTLIEREDEWLTDQLRARPRLPHLLAAAFRISALDDDDAFRQKRAAYRQIIRRGLIDDAAIDAELVRLPTIGDLTPLDIRAIQIIEDLAGADGHPNVSGAAVIERLGGDLAIGQAVLGHLDRLLVIQPSRRTWGEAEGSAEAGIPSSLRFTVFGAQVMDDLRSQS